MHKAPPGPPLPRIMAKLFTPLTEQLLTRDCFHCEEPMLYAPGQFAMTHRRCRQTFRFIHGAFRLIPKAHSHA